jgi:glycine/serine hydroxymethyltransferase
MEINKLYQSIKEFNNYHNTSIPLCAAENIISPFTKIPLHGDFQERYIMGSHYDYQENDNFIGSKYLADFYSLLSDICLKLFNAKYVDARTLSGMNCVTTILMALTQIGDKIALLSPQWGGHASMEAVCERLGLQVFDVPYLIDNYDIDYDTLNVIIEQNKIKYILLSPSDIIKPFEIKKLNLENTYLLYDISQIMGFVAASVIGNPLNISNNVVLLGGTHKSLPGPTSGLILTNNEYIHNILDKSINPTFLRNTQMHQVISLLFALVEFDVYGA